MSFGMFCWHPGQSRSMRPSTTRYAVGVMPGPRSSIQLNPTRCLICSHSRDIYLDARSPLGALQPAEQVARLARIFQQAVHGQLDRCRATILARHPRRRQRGAELGQVGGMFGAFERVGLNIA